MVTAPAVSLGRRRGAGAGDGLGDLLAHLGRAGEGDLVDPAVADEPGPDRAELGQPPVSFFNNQSDSPAMFCQNMVNIQTAFIAANEKTFAAWPSPVPTVGDTLYTFLASRLASSFNNLNCANFGLHQTVTVVNNGAGAATEAILNDGPEVASF